MGLRGWRTVRVVLPVPVLLVVALVGVAQHGRSLCHEQTRMSALAPEREDHGTTRAALIGDSWAVGDTVHPAYPRLLAQRLRLDLQVSAIGGTGYLNGGACGGESFATRVDTVPPDAGVVFLAGGLNDTGEDPDELGAAVRDLVAAVERRAPGAQIVLLGVPRVPLLADEDTGRADDVLREQSSDAAFVDAHAWRIPTLPDRIHPTAEGHREYAGLVAAVAQRRLRAP